MMDYLRLYRRFVYSHYFAEGLRISIGVLLPALVAGYFGYLQKGIFISLGALCVSLVDNPGPIHHRRNGMLICCLVILCMSFIVGFSLQLSWLFFLVLPVSCFLFSMIGVYGTRATSVGIAALLVMVMLTHQQLTAGEVWLFAILLFAGGIWYTLLSLLLNRIQPYKLIQQVVGEYTMAAADYLRCRAAFYVKGVDEGKAYQELMQSQVTVQQKQDLVAELLFKTRGFVKESNKTGRALMMAYLDISDLLERAMSAHFDYRKLHEYFDDSNILAEYHHLIVGLARELDNIGIALLSGSRSSFNPALERELEDERERLLQFRKERLQPKNLEGFISLRHILDSIIDIGARIRTLHRYTNNEKDLINRETPASLETSSIVSQDFSRQVFMDNLSWQSNIFRHSVRVTIAALVAYGVGRFWSFGHSYWILLTVIFILKPGYGLTRTRNQQRIIGTLIGSAAAGLVLYFIKSPSVLLILLTLFMITGYSFMRWKYLVSISFMTAYLLIMFHLLEPQFFSAIVKDRVIDTFIGCGLAFLAARAIPSVWEKEQLSALLKQAMEKSMAYFSTVAFVFTGKTYDRVKSNKLRKAAWVSLANLSDAFHRMLSDPKTQQAHGPEWHRIVVSTHMIVSHSATLSSYAETVSPDYISQDYTPVITGVIVQFERIILMTSQETELEDKTRTKLKDSHVDHLAIRLQSLIATRQQELQQGQFETSNKTYLSTFKTITDQFYFVRNAVNDIEKTISKIITPTKKGASES